MTEKKGHQFTEDELSQVKNIVESELLHVVAIKNNKDVFLMQEGNFTFNENLYSAVAEVPVTHSCFSNSLASHIIAKDIWKHIYFYEIEVWKLTEENKRDIIEHDEK